MGKEEYISRLIDSMQTTVDTLSKEVLIAINRDEVMLKEEALILMFLMLALWG
jgi:hypothetical protein